MHSAGKLLAIVVGGVALGACGSSNSSALFGPGDGDGGGGLSGLDAASSSGGSSLSGSSSGGSSLSGSSSGGSSSSSGSSSGASSSSGGSSGGASGYAIPLTAPDGADFEYTAQVTVGGQTFAMQIDTGSTSAAVAGTGCTGCTSVSPLYTPSSSAMATGKNASSMYEDGSGWSGPIYSDTVTLGNGSPSVSLDLAEITKASDGANNAFFSGNNDYQGILGLGPSGNAVAGTTGYMPAVMSAGVANIFAFELCDSMGTGAGTMWLGGDGSPGSPLVYTPLLAVSDNNPYYAINVDGMSLGGTSIVTGASSTFAQPVLDTGTSLFYVPTSVFDAFESALESSSGFKTLFGSNTFATSGQNAGCVTDASVTDAQVESTLPALTLSLPNATSGQPDVTIQASSLDTYLYDGGGGQFCLAIQDGGTQDPSTFGDAFLQGFHTIVDLTGGRVGFASTGCVAPQFRRARHLVEKAPHRGPRPARP
jgi:Eukaryotic aspartyl protease